MFKKIIIFGFICIMFTSCVSSGRGVERAILEHQEQIDRAEEGKRMRDRAIEECIRELAHVAGRSEEMGNDVEDIIRELDIYHAAVQRLLRAAGYRTDEEQTTEENPVVSD